MKASLEFDLTNPDDVDGYAAAKAGAAAVASLREIATWLHACKKWPTAYQSEQETLAYTAAHDKLREICEDNGLALDRIA